MTKILSLLFLCLFFQACNKTPGSSCEVGCNGDTSSNGDATSGGGTTGTTTGGGSITEDIPNLALTFDANITFFNTDSSDEAKFQKAIELIKDVVATEEFKNRVLNFTSNGSKKFVDNGGFTNAQIYQKILDGAEKLQNMKNNEMDMEVELYYASTSTVGYTYPDRKRIWVNTKFFDSYNPSEVARNLFHEWLHKLGFTHSSSYSVGRDSSVPYAIGSIIQDIGKDFL